MGARELVLAVVATAAVAILVLGRATAERTPGVQAATRPVTRVVERVRTVSESSPSPATSTTSASVDSGPNVSLGPIDHGADDVVDVSGGEIFAKTGASLVDIERDLATADNPDALPGGLPTGISEDEARQRGLL